MPILRARSLPLFFKKMTAVYFYAFASVLAVSAVSLVGVFTLSLRENWLRRYLYLLVSLAVGALLGDALIHLIPEAAETFTDGTTLSLLVIAGILIFFALEKVLHWHHQHSSTGELCSCETGIGDTIRPTGRLILASDGLHNFLDGLILGAGYLVSVEVGLATTLAIILHEIPQEIGDFAVLLHAGYSKTRALWLNFLSALVAVIGTAAALALGAAAESLTVWLLPFAAGGFIYIALSDLVPELHQTPRLRQALSQLLAILLGLALILALLWLE